VADSWLIRGAQVLADGPGAHPTGGLSTRPGLMDCRISGGRIIALAPKLSTEPGEPVLLANGGALLPGLADHHLHLWASAAVARSIDLGGSADLAVAARDGDQSDGGWLRVIGAGAELVREQLDERWPDRPVRVQHRSGALWTLNSAAIDQLAGRGDPADALTATERRTGQLWRADARLRTLLANAPAAAEDVAALGRQLAAWGVTRLTEATPDLAEADLRQLEDLVPQQLLSLAAAGEGPRKLIIGDHDLPGLDDLIGEVASEHADGRPVAIHAVSAVGLALALAALGLAGSLAGDRIEHAAVCDDAAAARLAELGLTVITQPGVFGRHGQRFIADSPESERRSLWRYAGLLAAGVPVAISSDGPYGYLNPWHSVAAAANRADAEQVPAATALASLLTEPTDPGRALRSVRVGAVADLCLLSDPLERTLAALTALGSAPDSAGGAGSPPSPVAATFAAGVLCYRASGGTSGAD
jgi:predicted amidohydrolase YtcJ